MPDLISLYFDSPDRPLEVDVAACFVVRRMRGEVAVRFLDLGAVPGASLAL